MRYVIIRDDDTNALTPVECLERLYRPLLERGLPVNLATIPAVSRDARMANGQPEGFLLPASPSPPEGNGDGNGTTRSRPQVPKCPPQAAAPAASRSGPLPVASNPKLVRYLLDNPGFRIVQHGLHHDYLEFDNPAREEIGRRLDLGTEALLEAGFGRPQTFVAPYDRLSRAAFNEVARRFRVLSTGWFELRRLPYAWWPRYAVKKIRGAPHWQVGRTLLLTHPGCLLSYQHTYATMLGAIVHCVEHQPLTVLVTHWWEYFREGRPDQPFIDLLHETGDYLAGNPEIKVISFSDLATERIPLN